jgi:hypothetical protein
MPEISGNSLFVVVQVLDEKIQALKERIDQTDPEDALIADWEEELLTYSQTAMELRAGYEEAVATSGNLPPYDELITHHPK